MQHPVKLKRHTKLAGEGKQHLAGQALKILNVSFTLVTGHKHKLMPMLHVYWICHNKKGIMSYNEL